MTWYRKLLCFRAHHIKQVLVLFVFLLIFEGVYISIKYEKPIPKENAVCQGTTSCYLSSMSYLVKRTVKDDIERINICLNGSLIYQSTNQSLVHVLLIDSLVLTRHTLTSYSFEEFFHLGSQGSFFPLNKYFVVTFFDPFDVNTTREALVRVFRQRPLRDDVIGHLSVVSGFAYNSTGVHLEQVYYDRQDSYPIEGCLKEHEGLTTCRELIQCPAGEVSFYVKAGSSIAGSTNGSAAICYGGDFYKASKIIDRGLDVLLIDDKTLALKEVRHFDTYKDGDGFDDYLRAIGGRMIVIIASEGNATKSLRASSRLLLEQYFGSTLIRKMASNHHFVFLGQRGLHSGSALEKLRKHYINRPVELKGCLDARGVGLLRPLPEAPNVPVFPASSSSSSSSSSSGCHPVNACADDHVAVSIYTGFKNVRKPRACLNGRVVDGALLGRGLNFVVFNISSQSVSAVRNFDTYDSDRTGVEEFIEGLPEDSHVVVFTHDDAARMMSNRTRSLLGDLGGRHVRMLGMRDAWLLVSRRNVQHNSPYERIGYSQYQSLNWSEPIIFHECIPAQVRGQYMPGIATQDNEKLKYCQQHQYNNKSKTISWSEGELCSGVKKWQPNTAKLVQSHKVSLSAVYKLPFLIFISSVELVAQSQLTHLRRVAGLRTQNVYVFYDPSASAFTDLIDLFGFKKIAYDGKDKDDHIRNFLRNFEDIPLDLIVLEEGVMATMYLLEYFAHLHGTYTRDQSLYCVSAYNHHAYLGATSSSKLVAYRTHDPPQLGYMVKATYYNPRVPRSNASLTPSVSFVVRHPLTSGYTGTSPLVRSYAQGPLKRISNLEALHWLRYDESLQKSIANSFPLYDLTMELLEDPSMVFLKSVVHVFQQTSVDDLGGLKDLTSSLTLSTPADDHSIFGCYKGVFRFVSRKGVHVFLVGSRSPFV